MEEGSKRYRPFLNEIPDIKRNCFLGKYYPKDKSQLSFYSVLLVSQATRNLIYLWWKQKRSCSNILFSRNSRVCLPKSRAMKSKISCLLRRNHEISYQRSFEIKKIYKILKLSHPPSYVLGGTHMTNPALLISRILKELTATEDTFYG